jgi:hypothetical protein
MMMMMMMMMMVVVVVLHDREGVARLTEEEAGLEGLLGAAEGERCVVCMECP